MRKIQEKYKDDRQRLQEETQEFYKREGYNPMSAGCSGGMLLQFPIIFGLIAAIYRPLQYTVKTPGNVIAELSKAAVEFFKDASGKETIKADNLQIQLRIAENIDKFKGLFGEGKLAMAEYDKIVVFASNFKFLGLQLGLTPKEGGSWVYYLIPVLVGVTSMATSLYTTLRQRKTNPAQQQGMAMMLMMSLGMPLMSVWFSLSFPVGIGIYWIVSSLAGLVQIIVLGWTHPPQKMLAKSMVDETIERRSRENSRKKVAEI